MYGKIRPLLGLVVTVGETLHPHPAWAAGTVALLLADEIHRRARIRLRRRGKNIDEKNPTP